MKNPADYFALKRFLSEAIVAHPIRLLAYCVMPNHWHLVLWPRHDSDLTEFLRWLGHTHVMHWHAHFEKSGTGHLYQGRFKLFPLQKDEHLSTVVRYAERNALGANLGERAIGWRLNSLWRRQAGDLNENALLSTWPVPISTQ